MGTIRDLPVELTTPAAGDMLAASDVSDMVDKDKWLDIARFRSIHFESDVLLVDAVFATPSVSPNRYTTITSALAACTGGETILIAPGIYEESITISDDNITLVGSGIPAYDATTGRLVGGTIIRGRVSTGVVTGLTIRDLGVDLANYTTNAYDCIGATNADFVANRTFQNLALLGNSDTSTYAMHGLYVVGSNTQVSNLRAYHCFHGLAVHGNRASLNNLYFYACYGTSLVIKGKNGFDVYGINVSNVVLEGTTSIGTGRAGPIEIQNADATNTYDVNISNVTATKCILGVFQIFLGEDDGSVHDITLSNVVSREANNAAGTGDFRIVEADRLTLVNCQSLDRDAGYGFQFDDSPTVSDVRLVACIADASGSGAYSRGASLQDFDVREINGERYVPDGFQTTYGSALNQQWMKGLYVGSASVTAANTPICSLTNASDTATEYYGLLFITARNGTGTANNSASYVIHVHKYYNQTGVEVVQISSAGLDTGAAAAYPSFTFVGDYANNHLEVTPIGSTSGTFYFTITAIGNIKPVSL